jgi:hypothetical protein
MHGMPLVVLDLEHERTSRVDFQPPDACSGLEPEQVRLKELRGKGVLVPDLDAVDALHGIECEEPTRIRDEYRFCIAKAGDPHFGFHERRLLAARPHAEQTGLRHRADVGRARSSSVTCNGTKRHVVHGCQPYI